MNEPTEQNKTKPHLIRKDLRLYSFIILTATCIIILVNYFFTEPEWYAFALVIGSVIFVIALDGVIASITFNSQKKLNPFSKFFIVSKRQKNFISKLGVRHFKDHLPDLGTLVKFPKSKIAKPGSLEYITKYLYESCAGEVGHIFGSVFGFVLIVILPFKYIFYITLPVATVNFILCNLPALALRYNRYALYLLHKKLSRAETMKIEKELQAQS